jgi:hypothetical protein
MAPADWINIVAVIALVLGGAFGPATRAALRTQTTCRRIRKISSELRLLGCSQAEIQDLAMDEVRSRGPLAAIYARVMGSRGPRGPLGLPGAGGPQDEPGPGDPADEPTS